MEPGRFERGIEQGQLLWRGLAHLLTQPPVVIREKALVEALVGIGGGLEGGFGKNLGDLLLQQRRVLADELQVAQFPYLVQLPLLPGLPGEGVQGHDHRRMVDAHHLQRDARLTFWQLVTGGVETLADGFGAQLQQGRGIHAQIVNDDTVAIGWMPGHRHHHRDTAQPRRVLVGDVHHRALFLQTQLLRQPVLVPVREHVVEQPRLLLLHQLGQGNGGLHVHQCVVGALVLDAVGCREQLQAETGDALLVLRPMDSFGSQRMGETHHVDDVPAGVAVPPLPCVGIEEVAVEPVAGELVVEADAVVAQGAGTGPRQLVMDGGEEIRLADPFLLRLLGRDAGDQAGARLGQHVVRRSGVDHQRPAHGIEIEIGTQAGELHRPVAPRIGSPGLVVVPVEGGGLFHWLCP